MKLLTCSATALVAALWAVSANAQTIPARTPVITQQPVLKISKEALKAIIDLQKTVEAKDFANVPAKAQAASALAKTADDRYAIAQLQLKAAVAANDDNAALAAVDAMAASNYLKPNEIADLYSGVGVDFYNAKRFDEAVNAFQKAANLTPADPKRYEMISEARNAQGRPAEASAALQKAMELSQASGGKPDEAMLKRALSLAYDAKSPTAITLGRQWISAYPSPTSWRNAIGIYRNMTHPDEEATLDLLRLLDATGGLTQAADYQLFATATAAESNYVEAKAIVDKGLAAKHIDPASPEFRDIIAALKARQQPSEADLEAAAKSAPEASTLIHIGDRYYALGNYTKAAETYRAALAKPGADANIANLHIGMALARSGDKAGAAAALGKVGGQVSDVAKYWLLYVQGA